MIILNPIDFIRRMGVKGSISFFGIACIWKMGRMF